VPPPRSESIQLRSGQWRRPRFSRPGHGHCDGVAPMPSPEVNGKGTPSCKRSKFQIPTLSGAMATKGIECVERCCHSYPKERPNGAGPSSRLVSKPSGWSVASETGSIEAREAVVALGPGPTMSSAARLRHSVGDEARPPHASQLVVKCHARSSRARCRWRLCVAPMSKGIRLTTGSNSPIGTCSRARSN
jgi:hypothetical protein